MADHTDHVLIVTKSIVSALKNLDIAVDVAAVIKSVTIECQTVGVFGVKLESHADIDDARFNHELHNFLSGVDDEPDHPSEREQSITGGDIS